MYLGHRGFVGIFRQLYVHVVFLIRQVVVVKFYVLMY